MTAPARRTAPTHTAPKSAKTSKPVAKTAKTGTRTSTVKPVADPPKPKTAAPSAERAADRSRSAAAERAYARRAQRSQRTMVGPKTERKAGSAGRVTFVVLVIGLLIGGVVASLWFSTQATADAYSLEQAKKQTVALQQQVQGLQQQVANADSAPSLAARARALGMVPAGDPARLVVGANGQVSVVGTPAKATSPPPVSSYTPTTVPTTTSAGSSTTTTPSAPAGR